MFKSEQPEVFCFHAEKDQSIRTIIDDGNVFFAANDVAKALGYLNSPQAVKRHCHQRGILKRYTPTTSGVQPLLYLSESNVYRLVIRSKKPQALAFEAWIMEEVIPSIRKKGYYFKKTQPLPLPEGKQKKLPFHLIDQKWFDYVFKGKCNIKQLGYEEALKQLVFGLGRMAEENFQKSEFISHTASYISQMEQTRAMFFHNNK